MRARRVEEGGEKDAAAEEHDEDGAEVVWQRLSGWRWKRTGEARERKGVEGLNGHWKPLSSSLRKLSRAELRLLMPAMASTS